MTPKSTLQGPRDDIISIVCARCGEEKPAGDFVSQRRSAGNTKNCLDCRNQLNSHVSSVSPFSKTSSSNLTKHSRSRGAIMVLRSLGVHPSSLERTAVKRTDGDAGLSPPNERSGTQPTSPETLRHLHTARRLFEEPISQPQVVLGTPIPPTQQSLRNFRTLAPSPPIQPTTDQIASHSDPSTVPSSTTDAEYSYLASRFHKGGKDSQDDASKAEAKARQVAIQRDHRSRRRAGETVSLTPSISQLGVFAVPDELGEGIPRCDRRRCAG